MLDYRCLPRWTAQPDCPACKGKRFWQDSYFDVGDVHTRYFDVTCYKCYVKWLENNELGFGVVRKGSYRIFQWNDTLKQFEEFDTYNQLAALLWSTKSLEALGRKIIPTEDLTV